MKKALVFIFALLCALTSYAQQFRLVGNLTGFATVVDDSTYNVSLSFPSDLTGNSFLPTQIADDGSYRIFFQTGRIYTVTGVANATFSDADLTLVEYGSTDGSPAGQALVFDPQGRESVPQAPIAASGASGILNAAIVSYNLQFQQGFADGDSNDLVLNPSIELESTTYTDAQALFTAIVASLNTKVDTLYERSDSLFYQVVGVETLFAVDTGGGGSLVDGDYGDVTVSGSGTVITINGQTVTFAKFQDIPENTLVGRDEAGTGSAETLTPAEARTLLNVEDGATADQTATDVPITDAGAYYTGTDVEAALQEVADTLTDLRTDLSAIAAGAADGVATAGAYDGPNEEIDVTVAAPGANFSIDVSSLASDSELSDSTAQVRSEIPTTASDLPIVDAGGYYTTSDVESALQEEAVNRVALDQLVGDLIVLSGVPITSQDLGTFTGTTITDDNTIKGALQELETAVEAGGCPIVSIGYNDGISDSDEIDAALLLYDCIQLGSTPSDTIEISRPIDILRPNIKVVVNGYIKVMPAITTTLTADASAGDTILTVSSTTGFEVGQWVNVGDDVMPVQGGGSQTRRLAMSAPIESIISATELELEFGLPSLAPSGGPSVALVSQNAMVGTQNGGIIATGKDNLIIEGRGVIDVNWQNSYDKEPVSDPPDLDYGEETRMATAVSLVNCDNVNISGLTLKNPGLHGISSRASDNLRVEDITAIGVHDKGFVSLNYSDSLYISGWRQDTSLFEDGIILYQAPRDFIISDVTVNGAVRYGVAVLNQDFAVGAGIIDNVRLSSMGDWGVYLQDSTVQNISISNVKSFNLNDGEGGLLRLTGKNHTVSNASCDGCNKLIVVSDAENVSVSNLIGVGNTVSNPSAISFSTARNVAIQGGSAKGFYRGYELIGSNNKEIRISNFAFDNTLNQISNLDKVDFSNVRGLKSATNFALGTNNNLGFYSFVRSSGSKVYFSPAETGGLGGNTKFGFGDRRDDFTLSNTLNVKGGLAFYSSILNPTFDSESKLVLGRSTVFPTTGNEPVYIINYDGTSSAKAAKYDLVVGSSVNRNSSISFVTGTSETAQMYLSKAGQSVTFTQGSADSYNPIANTNSIANLHVAGNTKPVALIDSYSSSTPSTFILRRSRGTGLNKLPILSGDIMGRVMAQSTRSDTTFFATANLSYSGLQMRATEAHTPSALGSNIEFFTTANGTNAATVKATLNPLGGLNIGSGTFTDAAGVVNAQTGLRVNNAATAGNFLRGDGANFVSSAIQTADIVNAGGMSSFTAAADTGTPAEINDSETLTIAGGEGIDTEISGNTVTTTLDLSELSVETSLGGNEFFSFYDSGNSSQWLAHIDTLLSYFENNAVIRSIYNPSGLLPDFGTYVNSDGAGFEITADAIDIQGVDVTVNGTPISIRTRDTLFIPIYAHPHDEAITTGSADYRGWRVPADLNGAKIEAIQYSFDTPGSDTVNIQLTNGTVNIAGSTIPALGYFENTGVTQTLTTGEKWTPSVSTINGTGHEGLMVNLMIVR